MSQDQFAALILFLPFAIPCLGFMAVGIVEEINRGKSRRRG